MKPEDWLFAFDLGAAPFLKAGECDSDGGIAALGRCCWLGPSGQGLAAGDVAMEPGSLVSLGMTGLYNGI